MLKYKKASQELLGIISLYQNPWKKSCGKGRVKVGLVKVVTD